MAVAKEKRASKVGKYSANSYLERKPPFGPQVPAPGGQDLEL